MKEPDFTKFLEDDDMDKFDAIFEGGEDYASKGEEVLLRNANKNNVTPRMRYGMPLKRKKGRRGRR